MRLFGQIVYVLCALTSLACTFLLARGYVRSKARMLLWSAVCFAFLAINNVLLFLDVVVFPARDLSPLRDLTAVLAAMVLVFGLAWDEDGRS